MSRKRNPRRTDALFDERYCGTKRGVDQHVPLVESDELRRKQSSKGDREGERAHAAALLRHTWQDAREEPIYPHTVPLGLRKFAKWY